MVHRPEVFKTLYDDSGEEKVQAVEEEEVEWLVPQTEADVDHMMADLRAMGFSG